MNAANAITVTRILLIPVFLVLLFVEVPYGEYLAVAVFALAAGTDKLDGYVARRSKTVTAVGMFLDPLADKLLVTGALLCLIEVGEVSAWIAMVIIAREFAVTGLRLVAVREDLVIPASNLGKLKTLSQNVAIAWVILHVAPQWQYDALLYLAVALTVISGAYYFIMARRRLFEGRVPAPDVTGDP